MQKLVGKFFASFSSRVPFQIRVPRAVLPRTRFHWLPESESSPKKRSALEPRIFSVLAPLHSLLKHHPQLEENHIGRFSFFSSEGVQSWPTKKMSTRKVSSVSSSSSSFIAPDCGGKVLRRRRLRSAEPELAAPIIDCQSDSSSIVSSFDLVLSTVVVVNNSSANGEKSSLCESVPVQGADF